MKLDYGTLLSPEPLVTPYGFSIYSPTLREISKLNFMVYNYYLSLLNLNIEKYYSQIDNEEFHYFEQYSSEEKALILKIKREYEDMFSAERENISPVNIFYYDKKLITEIATALSFFTDKKFEFYKDQNAFLCKNQDVVSAYIDLRIYDEISDLILQRNGISKSVPEEKPKFKSKFAEKLYYRTKKAEEKNAKNKTSDQAYELPNIISATAAKHNSINIINIWDMTIYQLYDQFQRLQTNCFYDMNAMTASVWGDEKKQFDATMWYKKIHS